jgi:hypothetical protein
LQNAKLIWSRLLSGTAQNNIKVFRVGSGIFPWGTEYNLNDLPDFSRIEYFLGKPVRFPQKLRDSDSRRIPTILSSSVLSKPK